MRRLFVVLVGLSLSTTVLAAKQHREAKKEITGKVGESEGVVKTSCGCAPKITVDWKAFDALKPDKVDSFKSNVVHEFENIAEKAKGFCSDADSKKLFCANVKKFVVVAKTSGDPGAKHDERSKTMEIHTTDQMNSGGYKMKEIMDSW